MSATGNFFAEVEAPNIPDGHLEFLSNWTGVSDLDQLRRHVLEFWSNNRGRHHTYKCIQELGFLHPRFPTHPLYPTFIESMLSDASNKVLEVGCCFGTDVRFLLLQGVQPSQIFATDLHSGYYDLGKELFTIPIPPLSAEPDAVVVSQNHPESSSECAQKLEDTVGGEASKKESQKLEEKVAGVECHYGDLASANDDDAGALNPSSLGWSSQFAFVSCFAVLHVLSEDQVQNCLKRILSLLKPGGVLFGWTVGRDQAGPWMQTPDGKASRYLHSCASLKELMETLGFSHVTVDVGNRATFWPNAAKVPDESVRRIFFIATKDCSN